MSDTIIVMKEEKQKILEVIIKYCKDNTKLFPTKAWINLQTGYSVETITQALLELEKSGLVIRKNAHRKLHNGQNKIVQPIKKELPKKIVTTTPPKKERNKIVKIIMLFFRHIFDNYNMFRYASLIIAIVCASLSYTFTKNFLHKVVNFDFIIASRLSFVMIVYSLIAFNGIILVLTRKFKLIKQVALQYVVKGIIIIILSTSWLAVLGYSITSTIGSFHEKFNTQDIVYAKENLEDNNNIELYNNYKDRINEVQMEIKDTKIEIENLRKERDDFNILMKPYFEEGKKKDYEYYNLRTAINSRTTRIKKAKDYVITINNDIKKLQDKKEGLLEKNVGITKKEKITYSDWLSKIFPFMTPHFINFILGLFAATIIDVLAPLCLAMFMFLKKGNKENE